VAFPEPDYYWHPIYGSQGPRWLRAWVDGKPIPVDHEVHALKGTERVDVTRRLRRLGASPLYLQCGSQDDEICDSVEEFEAAFRKLGTERYEALVKENLLVGGQFPGWGVRSTWHWRQSFPPGKIVRIRHEYVPEPGFALVQGQPPSDYPDRCFGPIVQARLDATTAGDATGSLTVDWVKYILLTANNWKRPIGRFELVVEHPRDRMPSFCWDGPIERTSPTAVRARAADFVPKHDLVVYFAPLPQ
jgi:hypothetical protein